MNGYSTLARGGPYLYGLRTYNQVHRCVPVASCYKVIVNDKAGNGLADTGIGSSGFKVVWDGKVQYNTMLHKSSTPAFTRDGIDFGSSCAPAATGGGIAIAGLSNTGSTYGIMFDVKASQDTLVRRVHSLNLAGPVGQNYTIRVYTKQGSYKGYEKDTSAWTLVHTENMKSAGTNAYATNLNATSAALNFDLGAVPILGGTTQSFYILADKQGLIYASSLNYPEGSVWKSFNVFDILTGIRLDNSSIPFGSNPGLTARFGGKLSYAVPKINFAAPSASPSVHPSARPSAKPSAMPSQKPSAKPSLRPSAKPSQMPSTKPSLRPSQVPSRIPSSIPTNSPSSRPSNTPTLMPTGVPSINPSALPSRSPLPFVCGKSNELKFELDLRIDSKGSETSWKIVDIMNGNNVIHNAGPYPDNQDGMHFNYKYCLEKGSCYKFNIADSAANGITNSGNNGNGYKITVNDVVQVNTIAVSSNNPEFSVDGVDFGNGCWPYLGSAEATGLMFNGPAHSIMFDISGKLDIIIRRFAAFHINAPKGVNVTAKIYTKQGSYAGYEQSASVWTLVHTENMTSAGAGNYTSSNAGNFQNGPVALLGGTTQAFYVVLNQPNLLYGSSTLAKGAIFKSFNAFDVRVGVSSFQSTEFLAASTSARFSGRVSYGVPVVNSRRLGDSI